MTRHIFTIVLITFVSLGVASSGAETRWQTLAPSGKGFSIEVPGEQQRDDTPGSYTFSTGLLSFCIVAQPVGPAARGFASNRVVGATYLEAVRDSVLSGIDGTLRSSSPGDFHGYPSLRFEIEGKQNEIELEGSGLLVLTDQHLYALMTLGAKGLPNPHAERFFRSFTLGTADNRASVTAAHRPPSSSDPVVAMLAGPMLAVARLLTTEEVNPLIDRLLQNAPGAVRLGSRWGPSSAAWQQARAAITNRIALINSLYEGSGKIVELLESKLGELPPSDGEAIRTALAGPQAAAIVRGHAFIVFAAEVRSDNLDGPEVGTPAYNQRLRRLRNMFDEHAAPAMPGGRARPGEILDYVEVPGSDQLMSVWHFVVGKAAVDLRGAINLMMFDERERIMREIESAVASAK